MRLRASPSAASSRITSTRLYLGNIQAVLSRDFSLDDDNAGRDALRTATLNALSAAKEHIGSLDRVSKVVRVGVYLATSGDFYNQPIVADAASELLRDVFGEDKTSVRSVFGVASLPLGLPVMLDVTFEVNH